MRFPVLILLAACFVAWAGYGLHDLEGPDEARYVQVAKELQGRSNWFNLTVQGRPYDQKPPLAFWMFTGMLKLGGGGVSAWTVRLPSVLFGVLTILMVHDIARRLFGAGAGLASGMILLTSPLFMRQTPTARLDVLYTAWSVAAFWLLFTAPGGRLTRRRAAAFWLCVAGGFFTKGPLIFITVPGSVLAECALRKTTDPWRRLRPLAGLALSGMLIGAWFAIQHAVQGGAFIAGQIRAGTLGSLVEDSHRRSFLYYAQALTGSAFLPWSLFLIAAVTRLWRTRGKPMPPGLSLVIFWALLTLVVLQFSPSRRQQYLTLILPPLSILTAWFITARIAGRIVAARLARAAGIAGMAFGGALMLLAILGLWRLEDLWKHEVCITAGHAVLIAAAGAALVWIGRSVMPARSTDALIAFLMLFLLIGESTYFRTARAVLNPRRSARLFALAVESGLPAREPAVVGAIGDADKPDYHVYGAYRVIAFDNDDAVFADAASLPAVLVMRAKDYSRREPAVRRAGFDNACRLAAAGDDLLILKKKPAPAAASAAEPDNTPLVFGIAGDSGTGHAHVYNIVRQLEALNARHPLDGVLLLGDNLYGSEPFPLAIESRFIKPFMPLLRRKIPFYATLGNHDCLTPERTRGEINFPPFNMEGRNYHATTLGGGLVTFYFIDSETVAHDSAQIAWLRDGIARDTAPWKILVAHIPMQASDICHGASADDYRALKDVITIPDGIDLVLTGHNHVYERRTPADGVLHVTVGCSGKLDAQAVFKPDPQRVIGFNQARCFAWMQIARDELRFRAVTETGGVIDRFVLTADRRILPLRQP